MSVVFALTNFPVEASVVDENFRELCNFCFVGQNDDKTNVEHLQEFRAMCEGKYNDVHYIASIDTISAVNKLIMKHTKDKPIPYDTQGNLKTFREIDLLEKFIDLDRYILPVLRPVSEKNSAFYEARKYQVYLGISRGKYQLKGKYNCEKLQKAHLKSLENLHNREREVKNLHKNTKKEVKPEQKQSSSFLLAPICFIFGVILGRSKFT